MSKYKLKILEYYGDVKNQVDLSAEKRLAATKIETKKSKINSERELILNEISKISEFNLKQIEQLSEKELDKLNEQEIDSLLFKDKSCFFIDQIQSKNLSFLVITNQFISRKVQNNFK